MGSENRKTKQVSLNHARLWIMLFYPKDGPDSGTNVLFTPST